jgi:hypothetical protein
MSGRCIDCGENWQRNPAPIILDDVWKKIDCHGEICEPCMRKRFDTRLGRPALLDDLVELPYNVDFFAAAMWSLTGHMPDHVQRVAYTYCRFWRAVEGWMESLSKRQLKSLYRTPYALIDREPIETMRREHYDRARMRRALTQRT